MTFAREIISITVFFYLLAAETDLSDFAHEIVPILQRNWLEFQGIDESKGRFSLLKNWAGQTKKNVDPILFNSFGKVSAVYDFPWKLVRNLNDIHL